MVFGLNPHGFSTGYYIVHLMTRLSLFSFFRKIHLIGLENIPMKGPLIVCGTHFNQFVDAMILIAYFPREVHFLIAASVSA